MDKKLAGLVGVMGALAVAAPGQAATPHLDDVMRADTYADLLRPIPNATALLSQSDAIAAEAPALMEVQYYYHHHHHHHHHRYERPYYQGDRGYYPVQRGYYPPGRGYYPGDREYYRPRYHHHHHHHHHHHNGFGIFIR